MSGNGGVRNLRAMFESNSQPASPDVRGRSPGARSNGDTSRPLSKVRTNFVSVEPLKRERNDTPSQTRSTTQEGHELAQEDSMEHRRGSFSLNENRPSDAEMLSEIKKTISGELEERKRDNSITEAVPENAIASEAPTPFVGGNEKQLGYTPLDSSTNVPSVTSTSVSRATSESRPDVQALDSSPPVQATKDHKSGFSPNPRVMRNLAENLRTPKTKPSMEKISQPPATPTPAPKRTELKKAEPKQEVVPVETPAATPAKAPVVEEKETPAATVGADRAPRAKSRVSSGTVTTGGFIKPKPRSPTRPIKLPSHLTAHTASSSAKHGDSPPQQRTLSRRASTISNASHRPSIRPSQHPPMPRPKKTVPAKKEEPAPAPKSPASTAPSSFLERMMRPTASSASKVKDKIGNAVPGKK